MNVAPLPVAIDLLCVRATRTGRPAEPVAGSGGGTRLVPSASLRSLKDSEGISESGSPASEAPPSPPPCPPAAAAVLSAASDLTVQQRCLHMFHRTLSQIALAFMPNRKQVEIE